MWRWFWITVILGVFVAIAVPNVLTAMQRSKQKRTMSDIRSLATALEGYATDHQEYPKSVAAVKPKYIKAVPQNDGWGRPFRVWLGKTEYMIWSPGKDGQRDGKWIGATTTLESDIVYANGSFTNYPEGV